MEAERDQSPGVVGGILASLVAYRDPESWVQFGWNELFNPLSLQSSFLLSLSNSCWYTWTFLFLKVQFVVCVVVSLQISCYPFTNVSFFKNTDHHHQILNIHNDWEIGTFHTHTHMAFIQMALFMQTLATILVHLEEISSSWLLNISLFSLFLLLRTLVSQATYTIPC